MTRTSTSPARRRTAWIVLAAATVAAVIAAVVTIVAGGADQAEAPAVFVTQPDFQPGATPPCLEHQTADPNSAYEGGEDSQSVPQLTFLAYYTAAGTEPFCDAQPPTDTDRTWAKLYVQLTDNTDNVTTLLG